MTRHGARLASFASAFAMLGQSASATPAPRLSEVRPINLHDGVNIVRAFLPDGSSATIVQAWRANGNAHSHHDWLVLTRGAEGHGAAEATLVDPRSKSQDDVIGDAPFDGERVLGAKRFARGAVDGEPASLLLTADLDDAPNQIPEDHATATVRVFRLETTGGDPGESPLELRLIFSLTTTRRYCNADLALSQALSISLPADYAGFNRTDGCFAPSH